MNKFHKRRKSILEMTFTETNVKVDYLAEIFNVSGMTIRRDLDELEKTGQIIRTRGGAISLMKKSGTPPLSIRLGEKQAIKEKIGQSAASLINNGEIIALDTGSTTLEVARNLPRVKKFTVVSNCLTILQMLSNFSNLNLITTGGEFDQLEQTFVGDLAIRTLETLNFDKFFFGIGGIDKSHGVSEINTILLGLKQAYIKNSREVIAVLDSSKFGKVNNVRVCPVHSIKTLVTNQSPPNELFNHFQYLGIKVIVVE